MNMAWKYIKKELTSEHGMEVRAAGGQHHLVGWHLHAVCYENNIAQLTLPAGTRIIMVYTVFDLL